MESQLLLLICLTMFFFVNATCAQEQYKQQNRDAISQIVDGRYDAAIKHFEDYLGKHPKDLESMYGLAVAYARKGNIEKALGYVKQAVNIGLPFGRFLAGPRDLLKPLTDSAEFKALAKKHTVELLHGPMLGCITETSAKFWVRTTNEVPVQVIRSARFPFPTIKAGFGLVSAVEPVSPHNMKECGTRLPRTI